MRITVKINCKVIINVIDYNNFDIFTGEVGRKTVSKMTYKALALDLDGTLVDSNKKLSDVNKKAVWKAIDKGVAVILASGRPMFGVEPVADMLELKERGGYILSYNGGDIFDCRMGKHIFFRQIPADCIADICKIAKENKVQPLTYFENKILAENDYDEYVIKEAFCNGAEIKVVDDLASFVDYPVVKLLVVGEHAKLLTVKEAIDRIYDNVLDTFFSEEYFLEIVPENVAKDKSLSVLMGILGIDREELIACGDAMNDASMIKYAGLGVVMANAYENIKHYGDYIAPSNDDNGVAAVIEKFIC